MDFEWDESKARKNEWKHGITCQEATEVFGDDFSSCVPDPDHSHDEERYLPPMNNEDTLRPEYSAELIQSGK